MVDCFRDGLGKDGRFEYSHTRNFHADRPQSAPYSIGNFAQGFWTWVHSNETKAHLLLLHKDYAGEEGFECDIGHLPESLISP